MGLWVLCTTPHGSTELLCVYVFTSMSLPPGWWDLQTSTVRSTMSLPPGFWDLQLSLSGLLCNIIWRSQLDYSKISTWVIANYVYQPEHLVLCDRPSAVIYYKLVYWRTFIFQCISIDYYYYWHYSAICWVRKTIYVSIFIQWNKSYSNSYYSKDIK